ncbi:hypothetical protein NQ095_13140 [Rossellomorea sp. SC111]|uniref:hypothetical protein n=1 Tax=Rossellomorea sp. SC111 TaxID=2968985 RepID=UPI00215A6AAA|nr:hypothetical protein [Rossellomorea sp. SC111]MCR8849360.1 hypothetical protein [Rossellomorea sp. SC111]
MKYFKSFLAFEWITIIGASIALYTRWDIPLYICLGIVGLGMILTLYFTKKYETIAGKVEDM